MSTAVQSNPGNEMKIEAKLSEEQRKNFIEDDDEFEEFPVEDWEDDQLDKRDIQQWDNNWDDDDVTDEFSQQLRKELEKQAGK